MFKSCVFSSFVFATFVAFSLAGVVTQRHPSANELSFRAGIPATICSQLAGTSMNRIITSKDGAQYTEQREAHWSRTAWKSPACIYTPASIEDLRSALSILLASNTTFAVRGGGHSPLPLWANVDDGVLISMKAINDLKYNQETQTVRAGMGNTWGDLYTYLENYGRMVPGGRAPSVGLATILGGGLSHLSNLYGFVSDSVLDFEIINAKGELVTVTSTLNAELFYALKAGATNFGIVTRVTMRTYALGKVWGGAMIYTNKYRDDIMSAFATYQTSGQLDRKSALLSYMGISNNTIYVILVYLDAVERPTAFAPFYDIPNIYDGTQIHDNFTDLVSVDIDRVVPRWTFGATTLLLDNATYVDVAKITQEQSTQLSVLNGGSMVLMPQPISVSMIEESKSRGMSPMTKNLVKKPQMWFCINMGWNLESDDVRVGEILMETLKRIEELTKKRGLYHEFVFLNDAYATQDPFRSFGTNVYRKLERISRTVDPQGIFQKRLPGGFKLSA